MRVSHFGSCFGAWGEVFQGRISVVCVPLVLAKPWEDEERKVGLNKSLLLTRIRSGTGHMLCEMTSPGAGMYDMLCFFRERNFRSREIVLKINYGIRT
jgi:hypothetical protein